MTKSEVIRMAMISFESDATNVYDLDYYRARIKYLDDYAPSRPVGKGSPNLAVGKVKTDRERVKEEQRRKGNYKDLRK